ncbi:MAG: hypothetical protein JRM80_12910 [Nitrososphaerota archaeon]|nr:hypothetical protein [Nitrososphaerota archaeon]
MKSKGHEPGENETTGALSHPTEARSKVTGRCAWMTDLNSLLLPLSILPSNPEGSKLKLPGFPATR